MIKIVLNGCSGKMGKMITDCASNFKNLEIVAGIDKFPSNTSYPIFETAQDLNVDYDVLLDFSRAEALHSLLDLIEKNNKPLVICSTGFTKEDLDLIDEKSKSLKLFRSGNMSLGINLICSLLKKVTPLLYGNYDIEIVEKHHPDAFNLGVNDGEAAGRTIHHVHLHLIPRYVGDVENPRGGIRHIIPGKGDY